MDRCEQAIAFPEPDRSARCVLIAGHDGVHQAVVPGLDVGTDGPITAAIFWPLPNPDDEHD